MVTTPNDFVILVVNFIVFLVHKMNCCGYERPDALYDQVTDADVVVYGLVHSHTRQPRIGLHAYTAHMDVICFLKGGPMERRIDIKDAGFIPPGCLQTNLEIGQEYMVTLERLGGGKLRPLDPEIPYSNQTFQRMTSLCGLDIQPPTDATSAEAARCPATLGPDQCVGDAPRKPPEPKPTKPKLHTDHVDLEIDQDKNNPVTKPLIISTIDPSNAMLNTGSRQSTIMQCTFIWLLLHVLLQNAFIL